MNDYEQIAAWAGLECRCEYTSPEQFFCDEQHSDPGLQRYWGKCPRHENGGNPPDYSRDDVAITLLPIMVGKSFRWNLRLEANDSTTCTIWKEKLMASACGSSLATAITATVLELLQKEAL